MIAYKQASVNPMSNNNKNINQNFKGDSILQNNKLTQQNTRLV